MDKGFDFDKVGKRMPYTMPEGAFGKMESEIWSRVKPQQVPQAGHRKVSMRIALYGLSAVAAMLALVFLVRVNVPAEQPDGMEMVSQAFQNLNADDQAFMLGVYQEDVFMDEQF